METSSGWSSSYGLGIPVIDAEHRQFFDLIESLDALCRGRPAVGEVRHHLALIYAWAMRHFAHEEEFLGAVGCPALEEHHEEHRGFLARLRVMANGSAQDPRSAVAVARDWFEQHILGTDRVYAAWLDGEGAPGPLAQAVKRHVERHEA